MGLHPFIYSQRVLGFYEITIGFDSFSETKSESQQEKQIASRSGRPTSSFGRTVGLPLPTETSCMPVGRPVWSTELVLFTLCMPVDRAFSWPLFWPANRLYSRSFELWSLYYIFRWVKKTLPSSFYLLSPYNSPPRWSEDFSNPSRTQHSICRLERVAPMWLPTYLTQGI